MQNVRSTETTPDRKTIWKFELDPGDDHIKLPDGLLPFNIARVCIVGSRNRPINLVPLDESGKDVMAEFGRKFDFGGGTPVHIRGFPLYYIPRGRKLMLWPIPAHRWEGYIEKREVKQHGCDEAQGDSLGDNPQEQS